MDNIPHESAEKPRSGEFTVDQLIDRLKEKYWLIPRNLAAICAVVVALLTCLTGFFAFLTKVEINATTKAQQVVADKIGNLAADGSLDRINQAAKDTKPGGALDRLGLLEHQSLEVRTLDRRIIVNGANNPTQINADNSDHVLIGESDMPKDGRILGAWWSFSTPTANFHRFNRLDVRVSPDNRSAVVAAMIANTGGGGDCELGVRFYVLISTKGRTTKGKD